MKKTIEVTVLVDVHVDTPRDLEEAVAELRREAPAIEMATAGRDFSFTLRSRSKPKKVKVLR